MQTLPPTYRWPRARYEELAETGVLAGQHVELVEGQIVEMPPEGPRHAALAEVIRQALEVTFAGRGAHVRMAHPLALGDWDEPQPDAAVVAGAARDYLTAHPTAAQTWLVVEVADTTSAFDLGRKADVYAAAGIADYWVVLPAERQLIVCRAPAATAAAEAGHRYSARRVLGPDEHIAPLAAAERPLAVADLLP